MKTLDKSLDVDALTPSNLAELDVMALLNRYTAKLKKVWVYDQILGDRIR